MLAASTASKAWLLLAVAILGGAALLSMWGHGQTLRGDEWRYADWLTQPSFLDVATHPPPGKYALPVSLGVYGGLFETFGIGSWAPYALARLVALAGLACLLFELLRRSHRL